MRAVVQRVNRASVDVEGITISAVGKGFLVLLGVERNDCEEDLQYIVQKIAYLRIFSDEDGKMNKSIQEVNGSILLVSQFTLLGDARHGRRPSYTEASLPEEAKNYYERAIALLQGQGIPTYPGQFMADMQVSLVNDGPVTLLLDSRKRF